MRKVILAALLAAVALGTGLQVQRASAMPPRYTGQLKDSQVYQRELIVQLDTSRGAKSASAVAKAEGLKQVRSLQLSYATYQIMQVPAGSDYMSALHSLEQNPNVKAVGPNVIKHVSEFVPNDPLFLNGAADTTAGLQSPAVKNDQWGLLQCNAQGAWDLTKGDPTVVVAMLDTGINFQQEDLVNRLWTNPGEIAGNGIDDDGNGFIDDVHGYDFETYHINTSSGGDADPSDPSGEAVSHGNATASIVAAEGNNGKGISGVAGGSTASNGVRLMICRLGTDSNIPVEAEIAALDYAHANGAKVASMSFGGASGGQVEQDAIDACWANGALGGTLPIAAAGNIGAGNEDAQHNPLVDLPAGFPNCFAVGATTIFSTQTVTGSTSIISETKAGYSKSGPEVDICAPGTHIMAAANSPSEYTNSIPRQFTGTSAATPMVSGLAALCFSAKPSATPSEVRTAIENTALNLGAATDFGKGRINMRAAVLALSPTKVGDANGDGNIDALDLDAIKAHFGKHTGDAGFDAKCDCNGDGVIDELDVFKVGRNFGT